MQTPYLEVRVEFEEPEVALGPNYQVYALQ